MHTIAQTQKLLTFMSWMGECQLQKHTQHAPLTKTKCDFIYGRIKNNGHVGKTHIKNGEPRNLGGNAEEEENRNTCAHVCTDIVRLTQAVLVVPPSHCVPVPLCPRPIVSPSHCAPIPLCPRPIVSPSHCVPVPLCPHPIVSPSHCAPIPLCPHPIVSPSHCVPVPFWNNPA